jgi:hypothetical protein
MDHFRPARTTAGAAQPSSKTAQREVCAVVVDGQARVRARGRTAPF